MDTDQPNVTETKTDEPKTLEFSQAELLALGDVLALAHKASDVSASRTITHFLNKFGIDFKPKT